MKPLLFAFLLGLTSACGFAPLKLWPLTLIAFAGLLWLLAQAPTLRRALALGYWFGAGQFMLGLNWIATAFTFQSNMPHWLGWVAVVLLSLYLAVYPAMATGLAWRWSSYPLPFRGEGGAPGVPPGAPGEGESALHAPSPRRFAATLSPEGERADPLTLTLLLAAAWIVTEWLRATMFTGFAWNPVGVALLPTFIANLATYVGTYGLSGVMVLLGGTLFLFVRKPKETVVGAAGPLLAGAGISLAAGAGGQLGGSLTPVRIVQPNIGQDTKYNPAFVAENYRRLRRLTGQNPAEPRLVLWPEAAVIDPMLDERDNPVAQMEAAMVREGVGRAIGRRDILLTGGVAYRSTTGRRVTSATNSVFVVDGSGRISGKYDKAHLVPYGEYLPMRPILSAIGISQLVPGDVDTDPGPGPRTLPLPNGLRVGMQVCYEIIFSGEVVGPGPRPDFIFNPSNDAWFGAWGPPQHLAQARLRALEEGLPVLRATPTGISAVVDANGRVLQSLPWRVAGVIDATLPAGKPPTLFARLGNIAPFLFAGLLVLAALLVRRTRPVAAGPQHG
jgi:apolipoprotein N-acyltransferase